MEEIIKDIFNNGDNMRALYYLAYFLVGGTVVATVTYLGANTKGYWGAFLSMFPVIALISILTIYFDAGDEATIAYSQGLILMTLPLLLFVSFFVWFLPLMGLIPSILIGITTYVAASLLLNWIKKV